MLESTNTRYNISGEAPVWTDVDDMTSNRAEGCGVIAMAQLITSIASFFALPNTTIRLYCDNNEALRHYPLDAATYTTMTTRDIDLKMEMDSIMRNSPITFIFCDVKGHADKAADFVYNDAPQHVQRNIDMDKRAKDLLKRIMAQPQPQRLHVFPAQKVTLFLSNLPIVGDLPYQIQQHRYGHRLETRIKASLPDLPNALHSIEWRGIEMAFNNFSNTDQISRMKIVHQLLPTKSLL